MPRKAVPLPDWEKVLFAAADLQEALPDAVLVGGSAAAQHAGHGISLDAGHALGDLTERCDQILGHLESVAGWKTARVQRPVQILGSLDGVLAGVRQLIRKEPPETQTIRRSGKKITLPTPGEMLRIKAVLILKRNATRDYLDRLSEYRKLVPRWHDWNAVKATCLRCATSLFDGLASGER